ncbi:MAG: ATP-binding protein [Anaplasmataceae bacterium]|nr:ATP-binding protein [Anaplasmataceae bacterium]
MHHERRKKQERTGDPRIDLLMQAISGLTSVNGTTVYDPTVVRTGDKVIIPDGANLPEVIRALERQYDYEEQVTQIHVTIPVSPWDGAIALMKAIKENLGIVIQQSHFGAAHQMDVEVALGQTIQVPWGSFELPGMDEAEVEMDTVPEDGRLVFQCTVTCKRKYEDRVRRLLATVREIATKESLHRGKAFSIAFFDEEGRPVRIPTPKFFEIVNDDPIFNSKLEAAIARNIIVPIENPQGVRATGESLKRGLLFAGEYGVGKTLLASYIARIATANGWTFIYVKDAKQLPLALRYAKQFQPVVVFAEDVDRVAGPERTNAVNELLNQLDGIDSKAAEIMTILTTNHPDQVNKAMLRPGRVDMVLEVQPPDADTVVRMIKSFAKDNLAARTDLRQASKILAGQTPARVRETVGRSKLEALRRTGKAGSKITGTDLVQVAEEVVAEGQLFARNEQKKDPALGVIADGFEQAADAMRAGMNGSNRNPASAAAH